MLAADLARRLAGSYRFVFYCLDEIGPLGSQLAAEGFEVVNLDRKAGVDWTAARRLAQACRRHQVNVLHAHQYTPFFYASLSRLFRSKPTVLLTEHGRHYPDRRRIKRVIANRFLLRRGDRVTAVGQYVKQALIDHEAMNKDRIQVIHNGIDSNDFSHVSRAEARTRVRAELDISHDQPLLLQVARFHPVKDHTTAVHALATVIESKPNTILAFAGDGQLRHDTESLAQNLGVSQNVRFLGIRHDIAPLMMAADVLLLTSLSEGLSVTLLEAMAARLPIIATDVGGNGEVVIHGQTGLLSPRGQPAALAEHVILLLNEPGRRDHMGQMGRERFDRHFTQQRMHDAYRQLYQEMVKGKVRRHEGTKAQRV